ncbi:MAG: hypothetical protein KDK07_11470 [Bauldia sp.]|nr:hypothetical protein [Bauldia sp.]
MTEGPLTVSTDKLDYQPGDSASITAWNVEEGATIEFWVAHVLPGQDGLIGTEDDLLAYDLTGTAESWSVTDGGEGDLDGIVNGSVTTSWSVNPDALNQAFLLSATDASDGETATASFTDSQPNLTINPIAGDDVISAAEAGASVTISGTTTHVANGTDVTVVLNGVEYHASVSGASGTHLSGGVWSVTLTSAQVSALSDGPYSVTAATDSDDIGTANDLSASRDITVDIVPTVLVNVTGQNDTATANGAIFTNTTSAVSTGTGTFDSFLVIQDSPVEEGFNTDANPLPLDAKEPAHTNALLLDDILVVIGDGTNGTTAGVAYREFRIDINQSGAANEPQLISLDQLKIYQKGTGDLSTLSGTPLFDLDSNGDISVLLDAQWNAGSGKGDYIVLIPDSLFDHSGNNNYVYLYSQFGGQGGAYAANSGFEEWGVLSGGTEPSGSIEGFKYEDADGDLGTTDDQTPLSDWQIYLDEDNDNVLDWTDSVGGNGVWDAGEGERWTATDATGHYSFDGLAAGDYVVREVVQSGWTQLSPTAPDEHSVTLASGQTVQDQNFVNFADFSVSGTKFEDLTGDGKSDDDVAWSHGAVTIYIEDDGEEGFTAGDRSTTTDDDGNWSIGGLTLADVGKSIYEVVPGGSEQTGTLVQTVDNPGGGGDDDDNDFTNFLNFSVSGTKFEDLTGDGKSDDDVAWSHGAVTIYIEDDGEEGFTAGDRSTTTDDDGNWSIGGLTLADVGKSIYEVVPGGSEQTGTLVQTVDNPGSGGDDDGNDFTNFKLFDISGKKYLDKTGNGITADDTGLGGITVFVDLNGNKLNDDGLSTTTAADGTWSLNGLGSNALGKTVYEVVPSGYFQTVGNAGYALPSVGGENQANLNFANYKFVEGVHGLTKGFWGQHPEAWDGGVATNSRGVKDTANLVNSGVLTKYDVIPDSLDKSPTKDWNKDGLIKTDGSDTGILLGDANGNGVCDAGEDTLFATLAAALQIIKSSDSTTDTRQILMSQALAAQLNIYNGDKTPLDLVGEAVKWLKGKSPFVYTDGSSGKVDTDGNGVLSAAEYNTTTKAFTFDANGSTRSGTALTSNLQAWQKKVDVFDFNDLNAATTSDVVMADGEDLKNALMWFNQDQLVTNAAGTYVAWTPDHGVSFSSIKANTLDAFWLTLKDEGLIV